MIDRGVYVALFLLKRRCRVHVGRLGVIAFDRGWYAYVGSAQRHLAARLRRHGLRQKTLHWHIDYLAEKASMVAAIVIEGPKSLECRLAAMLPKHGSTAVPGFGCTDCGCGSHLFRLSG